jgi:hypothetical protein
MAEPRWVLLSEELPRVVERFGALLRRPGCCLVIGSDSNSTLIASFRRGDQPLITARMPYEEGVDFGVLLRALVQACERALGEVPSC